MEPVDSILQVARHYPHIRKTYPKGACLYQEGDPMAGVYFILRGTVRIMRTRPRAETLVWIAQADEIVGISSYLNGEGRYIFSAFAIHQDCEAMFVSIADFSRMIQDDRVFMEYVIQELCYRINFAEKRARNMINTRSRSKLIDILILLSQKNKVQIDSPEGEPFRHLSYSVADLAEMTGTSIRHLRKLVREFQNQRLIEFDSRGLVVPNIRQLSQIRQLRD